MYVYMCKTPSMGMTEFGVRGCHPIPSYSLLMRANKLETALSGDRNIACLDMAFFSCTRMWCGCMYLQLNVHNTHVILQYCIYTFMELFDVDVLPHTITYMFVNVH